MNNPNSIPEFLGIMLLCIIVMSIVGVLISYLTDGAKSGLKKIKEIKNTNIETQKNLETKSNTYDNDLLGHFYQNMIEQEERKQLLIDESRTMFAKELEAQEGILKVSFEDETLNIITEEFLPMMEACNYAQMWINLLLPTTGVNIVKVYNSDGFICGSAERNI